MIPTDELVTSVPREENETQESRKPIGWMNSSRDFGLLLTRHASDKSVWRKIASERHFSDGSLVVV